MNENMFNLKEIIYDLVHGKKIMMPANNGIYSEIKNEVEKHGYKLGWEHTRYSPSIILYID